MSGFDTGTLSVLDSNLRLRKPCELFTTRSYTGRLNGMTSAGSFSIRSQRQFRNSGLWPPPGCSMSISESLPVKRSAYHFCFWPRYLPFHAWPTISRGMS